MLNRFLGGVAACFGAAGVLSAQQAPTLPAKATSPVQFRTAQATNVNWTGVEAGSPLATNPTRAGVKVSTPVTYPGTNAGTVSAIPANLAASTTVTDPLLVGVQGTSAPMVAGGPATNLLSNGGCGVTSPAYTECPAPTCDIGCEPCGPPGQCWIDAGYWYGTVSGQRVPPLVTTAPVGTPRATAGALGQPGTSILYPNGRVNDDWRSGFYLNAGTWLDQCQKVGIEGNFFFLGQSRQNFTAGSDGSQIITRPFFNTQLGSQDTQLVSFPGDTQLVSFPGILAGSVTVNSRSNVIGGGANFIKNLCCGPCGRFDLLLGYTYFNLRDEVNIREDLTSLAGQTDVPVGTRFQVNDNFKTSNSFHGGNIGFSTERRFSHWFVGMRAGVALGSVHQTIDINGSTTITQPGGTPQTFAGGLLAQPSNIGRFSQDKFAVLPWVGLKLGCQLTPRIRTYVGYDYMYLSNVVRAGDQIDLRVNPTQIPPRTNGVSGAAFPVLTPKTTGASLNAIRIGAEIRF